MKKYLRIVPLVLVFCFTFACQDKAAMAELEKTKTLAQTEEQNKAIVRQFFEAIDAQNYNRIKELLAPDAVLHYSGPQEDLNAEATVQVIRSYYQAFPDGTHTIEDVIAEGNKVVMRILWQGTQKAEFQGIAPSGNPVKYYQISISQVIDGKIRECWMVEDNLGFMMQLGMELKPKEVKK
jgi:predicted ester cyclase